MIFPNLIMSMIPAIYDINYPDQEHDACNDLT